MQPLLRFYSSLCLGNPPPDCITGGGSTEKKYTDENQGPSRHSPTVTSSAFLAPVGDFPVTGLSR